MSKQTVRVKNARDTFVNILEPNKNYNNVTRLTVRSNATGKRRWAYIFFPVRFLVGSDVNVTDARLRLYMRGDKTGSRTVRVKRISENWGVNRITYNNRPNVKGLEAVVTKNGNSHNDLWEFDVTDQMHEVAGGDTWYGWRIEIDEDENHYFHSSLATEQFKPELEVTYTEAPDRPTQLTPGGNRYVSDASPVLSFDFTDDAGDTSKSAHQIQLATDENFTSIIHDTGIVYDVKAQHDLSADVGWTALTTDTRVWWRVSVRDGAGNWSGYSEPASFRFEAKGVLTMTAPTGDVIYDTSPTVSWTLTGKTQSQWQVSVRDNRGQYIYESDKFTSGDTSWTIPDEDARGKKIIQNRTDWYTIELRVWDTVDRESTVGSPSVYIATNDVQYQENAAGAGEKPANVTVQDMPRTDATPGVKINWTRSTSPDAWVIFRGLNKVATIEPGDPLVSGTNYSFTDFTARPGRTYTYRVAARVNGELRESPAVTMAQPLGRPVGIWLIDQDPDRTIKVQILDVDEGTWEMPEVSAIYSPLGASSSRIVTQSLRGYEGNISGLLMENETKTIEQQEEDMFDLKANPGRRYTLVASDVAIPVVINNVSVAPTPHKQVVKKVAFDFYQQGDPYFRE